MTFSIGPEHAAAQVAATAVFADQGTAVAAGRITLYAGAAATGDVLAVIVLAKPSSTVAAGELTLHPADAGGALILTTGIPRSGEWLNCDNQRVALGTVSDLANDGDFRVTGGTTAVGETSPTLYAGGMVLLGSLTFT